MLNGALISHNFARLLGYGAADLTSRAIERLELCPTEEAERPPAIYPPGSLERIRELSPWRNWATERGLIEGVPIRHCPTEALILPKVTLAGGYLYRGSTRERVGFGPARMLDPDLPPYCTFPEAHLVSSWSGADFFGNFMQDSLTLEMIPGAAAQRVAAPTRSYLHATGYRALLDLPAPPMPRHARIDRLVFYHDVAQNSHKRARYRELRARLRRHAGGGSAVAGIFLRRGQFHGEPRRMLNEDDLANLLSGLGFDIIDPEQLSAETIARRALDAPIVIAVEGSHLAHAIYALAEAGSFLVIQPPDRFAMPYKEITDCLGMRFGFVVGYPAERGFRADPDEIKWVLEKLA